ncbi:hypothetical protein FQA47_016096 [Oryzias melastigma]|uniref:Uncharacterized protein n=1 Tax=Oryzias melastigma TaxID=30732 RepID=A0A834FN25_ORYME|nr:hypothetical protein FQA47_016096 [Oryzias melastigma]
MVCLLSGHLGLGHLRGGVGPCMVGAPSRNCLLGPRSRDCGGVTSNPYGGDQQQTEGPLLFLLWSLAANTRFLHVYQRNQRARTAVNWKHGSVNG